MFLAITHAQIQNVEHFLWATNVGKVYIQYKSKTCDKLNKYLSPTNPEGDKQNQKETKKVKKNGTIYEYFTIRREAKKQVFLNK